MADFVGGGFQNSPPPLAGAMSYAQRIIKKRQKRSAQANGGTTAQDNASAQQGWVDQSMPGPAAATAAPRPRAPRKPRGPSYAAQTAANTHQTAVNTGGFSTTPPPPKLWVPGDPK